MWENKKGIVENTSEFDPNKRTTDLKIMHFALLTLGILLILDGGYYILMKNWVLSVLEIGCGYFFVSTSWLSYTEIYAYYDFSEKGLGIKYLFQKHKVISWDEFQQVCVCYANYSTQGERVAQSVICFVKKGEKKNIYGRWKTDNYYHSRKVIDIDYTDELYEEVKKYCPYEIPDLRGKGNYRL